MEENSMQQQKKKTQTSLAFQSSYKCGWMPSNQNKYERFHRTLLHGEDWALGQKYFAMYWIDVSRDIDGDDEDSDDSDYDDGYEADDDDNSDDDDNEGDDDEKDGEVRRLDSPMFENEARLHAERRLLKHLGLQWSLVQKEMVRSVTIFQNASPCDRCSQAYLKQLSRMKSEAAPEVEFTIVFSSLYHIRRPSCEVEKHDHLRSIGEKISKNNVKELKNLRDAGIKLRTTALADWVGLRKALQLPNTYGEEAYKLSARKREDEALRNDLKRLLA